MDTLPESGATPKLKARQVKRDGSTTFVEDGYTVTDEAICEYCMSTVFTMDWQRYVGRLPYTGAILPGMIFAWHPGSPSACEIIEVIEVTNDRALTRGHLRESIMPDHWVDLDLFRHSVVLSRCKTLPTSL